MQQQVEITESQEKLHVLEQNNSKLQGEVDSLKQMIDTKKAEACLLYTSPSPRD